ncbi:MAG TPA: 30S ribosomal protein S12 methylthiotransferase RimO, partial [Micromonosporaceae bacterium]|nr:30S ribosomal protein S12 methylthiotransferase RimO [Micromonosporaceae bacterium]
ADRLVTERAAERVGEVVEVLVESISDGIAEGRAAHQASEVDGSTTIPALPGVAVGDLVSAQVMSSDGADLRAEPLQSGNLGAKPFGTRL